MMKRSEENMCFEIACLGARFGKHEHGISGELRDFPRKRESLACCGTEPTTLDLLFVVTSYAAL